MKNLLLTLLICLPLLTFAQSTPPRDESGKIVYSEVVQQPEASQADLYARASKVIPDGAKDVIKEEPGAVAWQGTKELMIKTENLRYPAKLQYAVILQHKDGRYMYNITDLLIEDKKAKGMVPLEQAQYYKPIDTKLYFANGNLKPMGLAIQNINRVYQEEIHNFILEETERIKKAMAVPVGDNW